ncbi:MarR family winged helix-turn-helix transcriptional regulator [Leifsonia sp. NCR5]|uniref:MarR family winged helix-turn-helix transcriptional regulator n=1 Tax=Leifsonia sp. NCR5 TaxID=1978342 RepID=UPI000A18DDAD|nr:MarR family winged helix-turn-helix transcriptional regulator [Leifsonia sp. NCR5]
MYMNSSSAGNGSPTQDSAAAWAQVAALAAAVDATLGRWLVDMHGIGLTEYRAALHLSMSPQQELRISELANRVGLNQSSVTRLVGRMEAKGLVTRDTCPDDGRGVYAVITSAGLDAVTRIRKPFEAKVTEILGNASKEFPQLDLVCIDRSLRTIAQLVSLWNSP